MKLNREYTIEDYDTCANCMYCEETPFGSKCYCEGTSNYMHNVDKYSESCGYYESISNKY